MTDPAGVISDPIELIVAEGLIAAGIRYEREESGHLLDFYLPDFAIYIEVKQFPTERSFSQLAKSEHLNTILIQGRHAAHAFVRLIAGSVETPWKILRHQSRPR